MGAKKRFFEDLDQRLLNKTDVIYPSIHKHKKFSHKKII